MRLKRFTGPCVLFWPCMCTFHYTVFTWGAHWLFFFLLYYPNNVNPALSMTWCILDFLNVPLVFCSTKKKLGLHLVSDCTVWKLLTAVQCFFCPQTISFLLNTVGFYVSWNCTWATCVRFCQPWMWNKAIIWNLSGLNFSTFSFFQIEW